MVSPTFHSPSQDLFVYVSEDYDFKNFEDKKSLVWQADNIELGDWNEDRVVDLSIKPSKASLSFVMLHDCSLCDRPITTHT